ncbi:MAG: butyrate kinase [Clostridia bacterium]|nr:butyrate kinase [Clostridia bacterium]
MESEKIFRLLVINPGSTSTKISLFENETERFCDSRFHDAPVLLQYPHVNDQVPFRYQVILEMLAEQGTDPSDIDVFVGRGGSACTQPSGVTVIDQKLYEDTAAAVGGSEHAAKLGVMLAWKFAQAYQRPAYTLNPTNVDEFCDYARLTGIRGLYRVSHSHFLNHKAVAQAHAAALGKPYEECNLITAHIDGGVTIGAHSGGRMIDGTMGADGEGPFAPTRIGSVPVLELLDYIEAHSVEEVRRMCSRSGGFVSLFGTSNSDTVHALVEQGDKKAVLVWNTLIYQISKSIGEMSAVLCGKVDAIVLTGGLMRFEDIAAGIRERCGWIAPIRVYPGEMEQETMGLSVLKVLRGEAKAMIYSGKNVWQGFEGISF